MKSNLIPFIIFTSLFSECIVLAVMVVPILIVQVEARFSKKPKNKLQKRINKQTENIIQIVGKF